jgi:exoribonuclease R
MMNPPDLLAPEFQRIRDDLGVPTEFPAEVQAEAGRLAARDPLEYAAAHGALEEIPFITIDPPGSRDLDQAFYAEKLGDGYQVRYAIDDVGFFVPVGSAVEAEAWRRGLTHYSPDVRTPLYPPAISEGAASLLPGEPRPAVVFAFRLNSNAEVENFAAHRALVRSRAQLSYPGVNEHLARERAAPDTGEFAGREWASSLACLEEIGRKRERLEVERGGVTLRIPAQQVERWTAALAGYRLAFEEASEVEGWNAQISLMTGMEAARVMIRHGLGMLRALDPPRPERVRALRLTAGALGAPWPDGMAYDEFVRGLDPQRPTHAVLLHRAARVAGGAYYVQFQGAPPANYGHSAIAAPYAHVTAPLRRLADRYVLDLVADFIERRAIRPELLVALRRLPEAMAQADRTARQLESRIVDFAEARLLAGRTGEVFEALVIELRGDGAVVQITHPPVRTFVPALRLAPGEAGATPTLSAEGAQLKIGAATIALGQSLRLRLDAADPQARTLSFSPAPQLNL